MHSLGKFPSTLYSLIRERTMPELKLTVVKGPFQDPEGTENCNFTVLKNEQGTRILRIDIEMDKVMGKSATGKSDRIASTKGLFKIDTEAGITCSVNVNKREVTKAKPQRGSLL